MREYLNLVRDVIDNGFDTPNDRTSVGTRSVFGGSIEFDLRDRFPALQHKDTRWRLAFLEMLWFLRGEQDTAWLHQNGSKLWDAWADKETGKTGPIYGAQWRGWISFSGRKLDQIRDVIERLKANPDDRRLIVTAWNPPELSLMCLPPCHWAHQLRREGEHLHMMVHMRSWDLMLGGPFNIAQYALLLTLYARATGYTPGRLVFTYGDAHIYSNHMDAAVEMLARNPATDRAQLVISTENTGIDGYAPGDFEIVGYQPEPHIPLPVAV